MQNQLELDARDALPPWVRLVRDTGEPYGATTARVNTHHDAAKYFDRLRVEDVEVFAAAYLDGRNQVLAVSEVSRGTVSGSLVHPREVFRIGVVLGASAVILAHNHPSGDPTPSPQDRAVTDRLRQAGALLGIRVLDHVIVTQAGTVTSMAEGAEW